MVARLELKVLVGLAALQAAMAVFGGIGLMLNGFGMPLSYLQNSPFDSYVWPGIILLVALGLTNAVAATLLIRQHRLGLLFAGVGGMAALGWIIGELYVTPVVHWMQLFVAMLGGAELALVMLLLGVLSIHNERRQLWIR